MSRLNALRVGFLAPPSAAGSIRTWPQFARAVRTRKEPLLGQLHRFPDSVLVAGCQRSGTTILSRVIAQSLGMVDFRFGRDDELDAALILSGQVPHTPRGRYCFQTTYLNERYPEYYAHLHQNRLVWVLRNPYSVVTSLLYNWRRFAFNELFAACGRSGLDARRRARYEWLPPRIADWTIDRTERACLAYNGKVAQIFDILGRVKAPGRVCVVDYDDLVSHKDEVLPGIYRFIGLPYHGEYGERIHGASRAKAQRLSGAQRARIRALSEPVYERARTLITPL